MPKLLMCPQVIEIETPNLVNIETVLCVFLFHNFPTSGSIDFQSRRRRKTIRRKLTDTIDAFNAWPLIT